MNSANSIQGIKAAIASQLEGAFIDGKSYLDDEWELLKLAVIQDSYYALIEIDSPDYNHKAVYEVGTYAARLDNGATLVGISEAAFPKEATILWKRK